MVKEEIREDLDLLFKTIINLEVTINQIGSDLVALAERIKKLEQNQISERRADRE